MKYQFLIKKVTLAFIMMAFFTLSGSSQVKLQMKGTNIKDGFRKKVEQVYMVPEGATSPKIMLGAKPSRKNGYTTWNFRSKQKAKQITDLLKQGKTLRVISGHFDVKKVKANSPKGIAQITQANLSNNLIDPNQISLNNPLWMTIKKPKIKDKVGREVMTAYLVPKGKMSPILELGPKIKESNSNHPTTRWKVVGNNQRKVKEVLASGGTWRIIPGSVEKKNIRTYTPKGVAEFSKRNVDRHKNIFIK